MITNNSYLKLRELIYQLQTEIKGMNKIIKCNNLELAKNKSEIQVLKTQNKYLTREIEEIRCKIRF